MLPRSFSPLPPILCLRPSLWFSVPTTISVPFFPPHLPFLLAPTTWFILRPAAAFQPALPIIESISLHMASCRLHITSIDLELQYCLHTNKLSLFFPVYQWTGGMGPSPEQFESSGQWREIRLHVYVDLTGLSIWSRSTVPSKLKIPYRIEFKSEARPSPAEYELVQMVISLLVGGIPDCHCNRIAYLGQLLTILGPMVCPSHTTSMYIRWYRCWPTSYLFPAILGSLFLNKYILYSFYLLLESSWMFPAPCRAHPY